MKSENENEKELDRRINGIQSSKHENENQKSQNKKSRKKIIAASLGGLAVLLGATTVAYEAGKYGVEFQSPIKFNTSKLEDDSYELANVNLASTLSTTFENYELNTKWIDEAVKMVKQKEEVEEVEEEVVEEEEDTKTYKKVDTSTYKGNNSINSLLKSMDLPTDKEFRAQLAVLYGIVENAEDYKANAEQNNALFKAIMEKGLILILDENGKVIGIKIDDEELDEDKVIEIMLPDEIRDLVNDYIEGDKKNSGNNYKPNYKTTTETNLSADVPSDITEDLSQNVELPQESTPANNQPTNGSGNSQNNGSSNNSSSGNTGNQGGNSGSQGGNTGNQGGNGETPVDPTPVDPTPVDPTPVDPTPVDPTPVDPTPVDPTPVDPTPEEPTPGGCSHSSTTTFGEEYGPDAGTYCNDCGAKLAKNTKYIYDYDFQFILEEDGPRLIRGMKA